MSQLYILEFVSLRGCKALASEYLTTHQCMCFNKIFQTMKSSFLLQPCSSKSTRSTSSALSFIYKLNIPPRFHNWIHILTISESVERHMEKVLAVNPETDGIELEYHCFLLSTDGLGLSSQSALFICMAAQSFPHSPKQDRVSEPTRNTEHSDFIHLLFQSESTKK